MDLEGFIPQGEKINIEMKAENFLEQHVSRNLVMVSKWRSNGRIKACRIHDTLRNFAKKQAKIENVFGEVKKENQGNPELLNDYRRLCINDVDIPGYFLTERPGKVVRSLLASPKEETAVDEEVVMTISKSYEFLRVLEIQSLNSNKYSSGISNLLLLQYAAISFKNSCIPLKFSKMLNLQTLIVTTESPTFEIRVDLWSLPRFRHLHTNSSAILCPPTSSAKRQTENSNIQTLSTIAPESCKEVFDRSPNLKKLGVRGKLSGDSYLFEKLYRLGSVENLKLENDTTGPNARLEYLSQKTAFPPNLKRLTLFRTRLNWTEMAKLGELPALEILKLREYACEGEVWEPRRGGFQSLKHLFIGRCELIHWNPSAEHFPALESLELNNCDKLQVFPKALTTLQSVVLHCTSNSMASSARRYQVFVLEEEKRSKRKSNFKLSIYPQII